MPKKILIPLILSILSLVFAFQNCSPQIQGVADNSSFFIPDDSCQAGNIDLQINPSGGTTASLSRDSEEIRVTGFCRVGNATDYFLRYRFESTQGSFMEEIFQSVDPGQRLGSNELHCNNGYFDFDIDINPGNGSDLYNRQVLNKGNNGFGSSYSFNHEVGHSLRLELIANTPCGTKTASDVVSYQNGLHSEVDTSTIQCSDGSGICLGVPSEYVPEIHYLSAGYNSMRIEFIMELASSYDLDRDSRDVHHILSVVGHDPDDPSNTSNGYYHFGYNTGNESNVGFVMNAYNGLNQPTWIYNQNSSLFDFPEDNDDLLTDRDYLFYKIQESGSTKTKTKVAYKVSVVYSGSSGVSSGLWRLQADKCTSTSCTAFDKSSAIFATLGSGYSTYVPFGSKGIKIVTDPSEDDLDIARQNMTGVTWVDGSLIEVRSLKMKICGFDEDDENSSISSKCEF
ncbi:MAG: hypothetical protein AB8E15_12855 [Bdellovibrionales bacterium]